MRADLTYGAFAARVRDAFEVRRPDGPPMPLVLVEATTYGLARAGDEPAQFSLIFQGPREPFLAQATYEVGHPMLGVFSLFLVPLALEHDGYRYEAVFNRIPDRAVSTP